MPYSRPEALAERGAGGGQNRVFTHLLGLTQTIAQVQVLFFHVTPDTCQVHVSRDQVSVFGRPARET